MSEQAFQNYFLSIVEHGYRIAQINGGGFPDILLIHNSLHSFVELKELTLGPSGDKKLKGLFKKSQPPWYANYISKYGERLFVVFKIVTSEGQKKYGVLRVYWKFVTEIPNVRYSDLKDYDYREFDTLKELTNYEFGICP